VGFIVVGPGEHLSDIGAFDLPLLARPPRMSTTNELAPETTYLGGHVVPPEYAGRRGDLRRAGGGGDARGLRAARWADVFCEPGPHAFGGDGWRCARPSPTPEFMKMLGEFQSATAAMADAGVLVDSSPLQPPQTATTVRVRDGETQLSDGPFAEIKEQLGGYYILDCEDLDTALRWAAMIPSARYGSVEVRPLMVMGPH
jgi:hypothetical protein